MHRDSIAYTSVTVRKAGKMHFCPECGTTLYGENDLRPDYIIVAAGTFADPEFPRPARSIWEQSKHGWVAFEHEVAHFPQAPST